MAHIVMDLVYRDMTTQQEVHRIPGTNPLALLVPVPDMGTAGMHTSLVTLPNGVVYQPIAVLYNYQNFEIVIGLKSV